jgi:small-conductance mechanosensitive channel
MNMNEFQCYLNIFANYFGMIWRHTIITVGSSHIQIGNLFLSLMILFIGLRYSKRVKEKIKDFIWKHHSNDKHAASVLEKLSGYGLTIIFIVLILEISNIPLSSFAFIGGALALGIGLGAQNLMNNFISSIILALEKPLTIGDTVEIEGVIGTVSAVSARCITIITDSNVEVLVPTSKLLQNNLVNWTLNDNLVKKYIAIRIAAKDEKKGLLLSHEKAQKIIEKVLNRDENISIEQKPVVDLHDVDDTSCNYIVSYWYDLSYDIPLIKVQGALSSALLKELSSYDIKFSIAHLKDEKLTSKVEEKAV